MEKFDHFVRCYPFSLVLYAGHEQCCNQMSLIPVLSHSFKCQTCLLRRDIPAGMWHQFFQPMSVWMNILPTIIL